MIDKTEQLQIHYEFAMSIGTSMDLKLMLRSSLTTMIRKMHCLAGGIHFHQGGPGDTSLQNILTIPRTVTTLPSYRAALNHWCNHGNKQPGSTEPFPPLFGRTEEHSFTINELPGLGILVLLSKAPFDQLFIQSLEPIFAKLTMAAKACLQNEELSYHQRHLKELVAERTAELLTKNRQLTEEIRSRHRYEQALRESEEKYRELVENANSIILRWDTSGRITFFNEFAQSFFGFTEQEIIGRHVVDTIVPETDNNGRDLRPLMEEICNQPEKYEHNVNENMRKDGSRVWVAWTNKVLTDDEGEPIGALSIGVDITDRYHSEQRFKLAAQAISDLIYEWDLEHDSLQWFGDIDGALGFAPGELAHSLQAWMARIHPEDRTLLGDAIEYHRTAAEPINYEYRIQKKNGDWIYWSDYGVPVLDGKGKPLRWIGACTDITENKRAEQELQRAKDYLENVLANSPDGIGIVDRNWNLIKWNSVAAELYGYQLHELIDHSVVNLYPDQEKLEKMLNQLRRDGFVRKYRIEMRRKDGSIVPYELSISLLRDEAGATIGSVCLARDLSETQKTLARLEAAHEQLQRAMDVAETANKAKSAFLANMSHELRTPLNAIIGFAELMTRDPSLSPQQQENLSTIVRSGEHLLTLINDVLEFSKIEAGRIELHREYFDLHHLLHGLEEMFQLRARQKRLAFALHYTPQLPRIVRTDQNKLRQILINLLGNAIKYTQEGEITLTAELFPEESESISAVSILKIVVNDTGMGIAPGELQQIFDAFYQSVDHRSSSQGTGLGLPISRRFAELMGGSLKVESKMGEGSRFTLQVPATISDGDQFSPPKHFPEIIGLAPDQSCPRLLVVEDNEPSRRLLVTLLDNIGFEVREAVNGKEAIAVFTDWHPHLIWMDLRMPVMDGYQAIRTIKNHEGGENTTIIALTASAFEEDRRRVLECGGDGFVRKPFRDKEIFAILEKHLGVRFIHHSQNTGMTSQPVSTTGMQAIAAMAELPPQLLAQLAEAAELSDSTLVDQLIAEIRNHNPGAADDLEQLAHEFAYDEILAAVRSLPPSEDCA